MRFGAKVYRGIANGDTAYGRQRRMLAPPKQHRKAIQYRTASRPGSRSGGGAEMRFGNTHLAPRRARTAAPVMPALSPNLEATISTFFIVPGMACSLAVFTM